MAYIGAGITRFNTADDLTVTDDAEIKGGLTVDTTTLVVDEVNNRVGIGTSSPTRTLDVRGAQSFQDSAGERELLVANSATLVRLYSRNRSDSSDVPMTFNTGITERMRIDSSGTLIHKAAAIFNEDGGDNDFRVESDNNSHMLFVDASTNRIGIGRSTSPSNTLHIIDGVSDEANKINYNLRLGVHNVGSQGFGGNGAGMLFDAFANAGSRSVAGIAGRLGSGATNYSGFLSFHTKETTDSDIVERFRINTDGDLRTFYGAIFNDDGNDRDFRVESDSNTHMLFVDASENQLVVGSSAVNKDFNSPINAERGQFGGVVVGGVFGTQNNNSGTVLLHKLGQGQGFQFSGHVIANSYTGQNMAVISCVANFTNNAVSYDLLDQSSVGVVSQVNMAFVTVTYDGDSYVAFKKTGGGTGTVSLNGFMTCNMESHGGVREVQSGITVTTTHVSW